MVTWRGKSQWPPCPNPSLIALESEEVVMFFFFMSIFSTMNLPSLYFSDSAYANTYPHSPPYVCPPEELHAVLAENVAHLVQPSHHFLVFFGAHEHVHSTLYAHHLHCVEQVRLPSLPVEILSTLESMERGREKGEYLGNGLVFVGEVSFAVGTHVHRVVSEKAEEHSAH